MTSTTVLAGSRPVAQALRRFGVAAALLGLAAGCGGSAATPPASPVPRAAASEPPAVLREATLKPGQPVPVPKGRRVLTLTGRISAANQGSTIVLDRDVLDQMGVVKVRVYEPWVKENLDFRGVWLQDLLEVAEAAPDVSKLRITALDDYRVDLTMADVRAGGILVATGSGDGSAIPVEKGGPTRIVFVGGVEAGANANQWIWSLKTIDVQ
jgi:hypothetical protein